jgi:hypothetical protein
MQIKMTCYIHNERETVLRCNRCEQPICNECAVQTPTGYRCKNCVKSQQKVFEKNFNTAVSLDYILAPLVTVILAGLGSLLSMFLGFYIIFLAPAAGWLIAEIVRRVVKNRRSRLLFRLVGAGFILGSLPLPLFFLLMFGLGGLPALLWPVVYAVLVTIAGYYRFSGIVLRV